MLGLLFGSGLILSTIAAWPIYLHLRKRRNMKIQPVPSLRLFGFTKRKSSQIRLRQLALLIMRVAFILALALLVAQPFIKTSAMLPLPPVAGEHEENRVLTVIVDDSISSFHAKDDISRLDYSKERIKDSLTALGPDTQVSFCLTTSPFSTPAMTTDEAMTFINKISSIPQPGDAVAALKSVVKDFSGKPAALMVLTSRNAALWMDYDEGLDGTDIPIYIHDTTEIRSPVYLIDMVHGRLTLGGNSEDLKGQQLVIRNEEGGVMIDRPLTTHEALVGDVVLAKEKLNGNYQYATIGGGRHPWQTLYFQAGTDTPSSEQVVIIRGADKHSVALDQLITGVILSFHGDTEIIHYDPDKPQPLPEASAIVIAGSPAIGDTLLPWLQERANAGVRILAFPVMPMDQPDKQPDFLPTWGAPMTLGDDEFPLVMEQSDALPMDDLTLVEVRQMKPKLVYPPRFSSGAEPLLGSQRVPILVRKKVNPQSVCWAFGVSVSSAPDSISWHPAFPFLVDKILFPSIAAEGMRRPAVVGEIIQVKEWFGSFSGEAILTFPDGQTQPLKPSGNASETLTIGMAGAYSLQKGNGLTYQVANVMREPKKSVLTRKQLAKQLGEGRLHWLDKGERIPPEAFRRLSANGVTSALQQKRLDLSPFVFWGIIVFLFFESILCLLSWRQRRSVSH